MFTRGIPSTSSPAQKSLFGVQSGIILMITSLQLWITDTLNLVYIQLRPGRSQNRFQPVKNCVAHAWSVIVSRTFCPSRMRFRVRLYREGSGAPDYRRTDTHTLSLILWHPTLNHTLHEYHYASSLIAHACGVRLCSLDDHKRVTFDPKNNYSLCTLQKFKQIAKLEWRQKGLTV